MKNNHIEVLEWAVHNGCPWDEQDCAEWAEEKGLNHILAWIRMQ